MTLTKARFLEIAREEGAASIEIEPVWPKVQRQMLEGKVQLIETLPPDQHQLALDEYDRQMERCVRRAIASVRDVRSN